MRMTFLVSAALVLAACGTDDGDMDDANQTSDAVGQAAPAEGGTGGGSEGGAPGEVALSIEASIDGRQYAADGTGECRHAADASIYDVPSAMWMVQYRGNSDVRSLSMTLWRPKSGAADQVSLNVATGAGTSSISTVQGGTIQGSANASLETQGEGGRFRIEGRDADGKPVSLEVHCPRFGGVNAVGG